MTEAGAASRMPGAPDEGPWTLPVQRSLPEMLAERVVEAIRVGILKPGERIVESRLSREFGVSRGPLREALKALEASGIVESRRGRGTLVRRVSDDDLAHMVTMRAGLEGLAGRLVAASITDAEIAALSRHIAQMEALARRGLTAEWRDHDWRFHETIIVLSGNPHLLSAWRSISNLVRLFLHTHPGFVQEVGQVLSNHDRILAALASGDPDEAERVVRAVLLVSAFRRFGLPLPKAFAALGGTEPETQPGARRPKPAPQRAPRRGATIKSVGL